MDLSYWVFPRFLVLVLIFSVLSESPWFKLSGLFYDFARYGQSVLIQSA